MFNPQDIRNGDDILRAIHNANTRFDAAILVRAFPSFVAAAFPESQQVYMIKEASRLADSLIRPYYIGDNPAPESEVPWRQWLRSAGYTTKRV